MSAHHTNLPQIGDPAPGFEVDTQKGAVCLPEYSRGCWCIFFAHPANFTSAWWMYSTLLALKERWFNARNTKLLAISNEPIRQSDWSDKVRRYIGIYLRAPIIEDLDFKVATIYGMASGRRRHQPGYDRLIYIIDPQGIIRLIIYNPLKNIEQDIADLEKQLRLMMGHEPLQASDEASLGVGHPLLVETAEISDATVRPYKTKPAYFRRKKIQDN